MLAWGPCARRACALGVRQRRFPAWVAPRGLQLGSLTACHPSVSPCHHCAPSRTGSPDPRWSSQSLRQVQWVEDAVAGDEQLAAVVALLVQELSDVEAAVD